MKSTSVATLPQNKLKRKKYTAQNLADIKYSTFLMYKGKFR